MTTERQKRIEENRRAKRGRPYVWSKRHRAVEKKPDGSIPRNPNHRKTRRTK